MMSAWTVMRWSWAPSHSASIAPSSRGCCCAIAGTSSWPPGRRGLCGWPRPSARGEAPMAALSESETIQADPSRLKKTSWREYAVRFAFGGLITALAAFLGARFGPAVGGLFLAFPAILPASLTLVKEHEGDDAAGAMAGSIGLIAFGALVWVLASSLPAWLVLILAALAWLLVGVFVWRLGLDVLSRLTRPR